MFVTASRWRIAALAVLITGWQALGVDAAAPTGHTPSANDANSSIRPPGPIVPRSNILSAEPWRGVPIAPLSPAELDKLVAAQLREDNIKPAARTTDEAFLRRVTLDLTGKLPSPTELTDFVTDCDPTKRSRVIDKLLASDAYASHSAKYWRDVITAKYTDRRAMGMVPAFEKWLTEQFKANKSWGDIAWSMLTAEGSVPYGGPNDGSVKDANPAATFLLAHLGDDQAEERAAETSRVFLGIQIQCAQCHDHPFDEWKQRQFHEFASYFSNIRTRQSRPDDGPRRLEMVVQYREHRLPDKNDPTKGTTVRPRFLTGAPPEARRNDRDLRAALADAVTGPENFWFAAAFVNRTWAEMLGQGFFPTVDDMGPGKDAYMPDVLIRLAASFRATDYDIKQLLRTICNSDAYQRQIRPGSSADEHLHFAAAYPTRLPAEALWQSLTNVLGNIGAPSGPFGFRGPPPGAPAFGRFGRPSLESTFVNEFKFDPSLKADEVEGSIPQALILMNNRDINQSIQARSSNLLSGVLKKYSKDEDAIRALYFKAFARKPTDHELSKAAAYVHKVGKRDEAFEDLLWALLNSTEFQTKR
jgi:hypothetical protein